LRGVQTDAAHLAAFLHTISGTIHPRRTLLQRCRDHQHGRQTNPLHRR
jgi:hypothetical protein